MKKIKDNNKKDILLKILIGIFSVVSCISLIKLLIPGMYLVFMNLLGISINLLSGVLICGSVLGIVGLVGLATKCVGVKTEYEYEYDSDMDIESDMMRKQLRIVEYKDNTVNRENNLDKKYSYVFDNNYMDVEDIEIDDIMDPNWRDKFNPCEVRDDIDDSDVKIYIRKK